MAPVHPITSLNIAELAPYRTLRRPQDHWKQGIFVAEGEKVVRRLLESDLPVVSLLMTPQWLTQIFPESTLAPAPVYVAEKALLESIVGFPLHQGIMAVGRIPKQPPLAEFLGARSSHFLVALDGVVHSENVGIVVRNCAAFGVDAVIVDGSSSSPYLRRAVRNSMGAVFKIPVFPVDSLTVTLETLKRDNGTRILAAHPPGGSELAHCDFSGNILVIFGNEGVGISEPVLNRCDVRVSIPMQNQTDSLNVASASAVFLYVAGRNRF